MGDFSSSTNIHHESLFSPNTATFIDLHIPPQLKFLLGNIKNIIQTPLTAKMHLIWQSHVLKLFKANGYDNFLTGDTRCPALALQSEDGSITENPQYTLWTLTNQNITSALLAMISPSILPYVLDLESCTKIWSTISKRL